MNKKHNKKMVNLGLQGGGSHGAFTWGVLDYLLEEGSLDIEGISATSAGSMNAVVVAHGLQVGGREGGRAALEKFWADVSAAGVWCNPVKSMPWEQPGPGSWDPSHTPGYLLFDWFTRLFSPYDINPLNFSPLRDILNSSVDFERLAKSGDTKLFINATNVRTGRIRVFGNAELTSDSVMASACLPQFFQAVCIDGDYYWDGGYRGNPSIFPLIYGTNSHDVIIVHINPIEHNELPRTSAEINDRLNEITFNGSMLSEFRAIAFVTRMIENGWIKDEFKDRLKHMFMHSIRADEALRDLGVASKLLTDWAFLCDLRDRGRQTCAAWLAKNYSAVGKKSSVDLGAEFLGDGIQAPK